MKKENLKILLEKVKNLKEVCQDKDRLLPNNDWVCKAQAQDLQELEDLITEDLEDCE